MNNPMVRQVVAGIVALIGGYLLYVSANPASDFTTTFIGFWIGLILFVAVAWLLLRYYRPGTESPASDEVPFQEWRFFRFLRYGKDAGPLYLGIRLFLAFEWLTAGFHKVGDPKWVQTGEALRAYWTRAAAVPAPPASALITFPAYRAFIQFMLDNHWDAWFASVIAYGEILIGLGFLFGGLIGFAAFFALLMNFSFVFAGSTSTNPLLIMFEVTVLLGWRSAGWWGVDRFLLPVIGTPWPSVDMAPEGRRAPAT